MEEWVSYEKIKIEERYYIKKVSFNLDELAIQITNNITEKEIVFFDIYGYKYSNESGIIDRLSHVQSNILKENRIFIVNASEYKEEYEYQSSGTRPMDEVKHFIILDRVDSVIEVLTLSDPQVL